MSVQRKYSINEIDRMRSAIHQASYWYRGFESHEQTEDKLRTHMLNGTEPEELEAKAREKVTVLRQSTSG